MIYYRIKKPVQNLDLLPRIHLSDHFVQAKERDIVSFILRNEVIDPEEIKSF